MTTETPIQRETLALLARAGCWAIRINSVGRTARGRSAPPGTPDILCVHPYAWVEMKAPGRSLELKGTQRAFQISCERKGIPHIVTSDPAEAVRFVLEKGWKAQ